MGEETKADWRSLHDWLLWQVAEEEREARETLAWMGVEPPKEYVSSYAEEARNGGVLEPYARRVLADCEAKRWIINEHREVHGKCFTCLHDELETAPTPMPQGPSEDAKPPVRKHVDSPCKTMRHLAAIYADREGYQEQWRPGRG